MAGHSKFKNIMHRKGRQDAVRSKLFAKLAREIAVAAKMGGGELENNPRLRLAVRSARAESMPKDNIERAIEKAVGGDSESYDEIRYEGYGPSGVAVIVEALTDNRNRTGAAVRAAFAKHGGNLGATGAVSHMFDHVGEIVYGLEAGNEDKVMEAAIESGADDVVSSDSGHIITCSFETLAQVSGALEEALGEAESAKAIWHPSLTTDVDEQAAGTLLKLVATLEDEDDVQTVTANFEVSDELLAKLTAA